MCHSCKLKGCQWHNPFLLFQLLPHPPLHQHHRHQGPLQLPHLKPPNLPRQPHMLLLPQVLRTQLRAHTNLPSILMPQFHSNNSSNNRNRSRLRPLQQLPMPRQPSSTTSRLQKTVRLGPKQLVRGRAATKRRPQQRQKPATSLRSRLRPR